MRISWERLIAALLILCLSFLAARYLGSTYYVLFRSFFLLFMLDLFFLYLSYIGVRHNQNFSSEHLTRGDEIHYDFYLLQSFHTLSANINVEFFPFNNPELKDLEPMSFTLKAQEKRRFSYTIRGGTRGIYRVGIKNLVMEDFLGFFRLDLPRHERTFYIYPRLFRGDGYPLEKTAGGGEQFRKSTRDEGDTAFSGLKEYRPGLSLRGISWKHFARYGFPVIRENENSVQPGRVLMVDRRSLQGERPREDGVLETALTLTRRILDGGTGVILDGISPEGPLEVTCESAFSSLYQSTLTLPFDAPHLPAYRGPGEAVTLISALPDWDLLNDAFWQIRENWQLVAVLEGMEEERKQQVTAALRSLQNRDVSIVIIEKGETFWTEN